MLYNLPTAAAVSPQPSGPLYSIPMFLQVEITSRCNLKCRMCPLTLGTTSSSAAAAQLADADWEQVKRYSQAAGRVLLVGFGEPLTHPRFLQMLHELDELRIETSFSTNGIGAEAVAGELARLKHLRHVNISIDSPDPAVYQDIRGGDVSRALQGMRAIAAAMPDRVDVTVNSVVMKSNVRSLLSFPAILAEAGVRYFALNGLHDYTEEIRREHIYSGRGLQTFLPARRLHVVMDELKSVCEQHGVQLLLNHRTQLDFYKPDKAAIEYFNVDPKAPLTRACTVPFDSMYVDSNGKVYPCCHAAGNTPLGDLRQQSVDDVWSGAAFSKFRHDLLDAATTPGVCRTCTVAPLGEHPFRQYNASVLSTEALTDGRLQLKVRNTGAKTWDRSTPLRLGTSRPRDRSSIHYHPSWLSPNRAAEMAEDVVASGEVATLTCHATPAHASRPESFQLLVEGQFWLPDTQFDLPVQPPAPLVLKIERAQLEATESSVQIHVDVAPDVPWELEAACDWIAPALTQGRGAGIVTLQLAPNWHSSSRSAKIRAGSESVEVRQDSAETKNLRAMLFCAYKLLRRSLSDAEQRELQAFSDEPARLIQHLLSQTGVSDNTTVAERLFSAFLDQTKRSSRIRALMRDLPAAAMPLVISRFLALGDVQAAFRQCTD